MDRLGLFTLVSFFVVACGRPPATGQQDAGHSDAGNHGEHHVSVDGGHHGSLDGGNSGTGTSGMTWYRDVLPIVQENCQGCHAAGGIAPFALITYADAASRHSQIASSVAAGHMPPWMPDDSCISLKNSRGLTQAEIDVIVGWSQEGAPEGDPADAPNTLPPPTGLPRVDATLDPGTDYVPHGSATEPYDDYHCFILPPVLTAQRDVIGMDVVPGTRTQVHHVILFAASNTAAQQKDASEAGLGWTCYGGPGLSQPRMIGGWVPGSGAAVFPADTGIRLNAGDVVVMQVHYNLANGAPVADRTEARLMYAATPVAKEAVLFPISTQQFTIPPNSLGTTAKASFTMPVGQATLYGVLPHMHNLGRSIRARNLTTGQCLIDIPAWHFHWQQSYEYAQPVTFNAGETVEVECVWDNPTAATVTYGEGSAEEMCMAFFYVTHPYIGLL